MATTSVEQIVRPDPDETERMAALSRQIDEMLDHGETSGRLVVSEHETIEIPASAMLALRRVVEGMAQGFTMTLVSHGKELTTGEAADILNMSRTHFVRLLENDEIPFHLVGTHRRVKIEDLLAFRQRRAEQRRKALEDLIAMSEELPGGYL